MRLNLRRLTCLIRSSAQDSSAPSWLRGHRKNTRGQDRPSRKTTSWTSSVLGSAPTHISCDGPLTLQAWLGTDTFFFHTLLEKRSRTHTPIFESFVCRAEETLTDVDMLSRFSLLCRWWGQLKTLPSSLRGVGPPNVEATTSLKEMY